ncbi:MAG TPA: polymer-forming cytoskeletal protein [Longimicrobium sp.]|nr:polymer-forming cytoskeletal protein [Longimicrobium sp.]
MRIDLKIRAAALLGALVAATGAAAQTLAPPAAPAPPEAPAAAGSRIGLTGVTVQKGQVVDGDVVSVGDVRIDGEVTGDVTVGKGDLHVGPDAVIHGDAVVNGGGRLLNEGGRIEGEMRVNSDPEPAAAAAGQRPGHQAVGIRGARSWLGSFSDGVQGLISTLVFGLVLAGVGAALIFYALPQLERVSHVVRTSTLRAGGVGLAANFLSFPAFVVGIVVLALSIVGIPLLFLYVPFFPVALVAAIACGVVAVAHALGERTAERTGSYASSKRNAYSYTFTGLGILLAPLVVGHLLEMTVFLGWLGGLMQLLGWMMMWAAATVGFGAVFLTRAGTRPGWPWTVRRAYDPFFDADRREAETSRGAHV